MSESIQSLFERAWAHRVKTEGKGIEPIRGVDGALASLRHLVHDAPQLRDLNNVLEAIATRSNELTYSQYGFIVQTIWTWPEFIRMYEDKIEAAGLPIEEKLWSVIRENVSDIISQNRKFRDIPFEDLWESGLD